MKVIAIIGGGASGLIAAYAASLYENTEVHLFEKNLRLGRKLLITGKGRCNVTNMSDIEGYKENIPHNFRFLYSALSQFNNEDLVRLLNENGLKTKVERGMRVFPDSDKAADVVETLTRLVRKNARVHLGCKVDKLTFNKNYVLELSNKESFSCDCVIVATGGLSYPLTGSTGDGYGFSEACGHSLTKMYPSLVALRTKEDFVKELAGLSLKNIAVKIKNAKGKEVYSDFGELLFTHFGVSGPVILSASARIAEMLSEEDFRLTINLKPALDEKTLDARIIKDFEKYKNRDILNAADDLLPKSMIPIIIRQAEISPKTKVHEITKGQRKALLTAIRGLELTIVGSDGFDHAVITRGGINTAEINPKTMESKLLKGLYFAGEIIDVDAFTGGYNLQIAFSTGYLAGKSAALE